MLRIALILLALVAAVLGYLLVEPLLYLVAGALVVGALVWVLVDVLRKRRPAAPLVPPGGGDDLQSLGIVEIRPKAASSSARAKPVEAAPAASTAAARPAATYAPPSRPAAPAQPEAAPADAADRSDETDRAATLDDAPDAAAIEADFGGEEAVEMPARESERRGVPETPAASRPSPRAARPVAAAAQTVVPGVLQPYLESLRAVTDAHTVCFLKQEELALTYRIEGIASRSGYVRAHGSFSTQYPLLKPSMAERPVTLIPVGDRGLPNAALRYYQEGVGVRQVAVAPVAAPSDDLAVYFLVLDTLEPHGLETGRVHLLIERYADLLGTLLEPSATARPAPVVDVEPESEAPERDEGEEEAVRPRREIIAEEMEGARARDLSLALALVHLSEAEAVVADGPDTVDAAEIALRRRLEDAAPTGRVVQFGELTYGIFLAGTITEVEEGVRYLQRALETTEPADALSIGIALLQDRHDTPDAFRADATEALRESYETGTWTILE